MNRQQELFNRVKNHLLGQMALSETNGGCAYRAESGLKCAVGCLITDEFYEPIIEGMPIMNDGPVLKCLEKSLGYSLTRSETKMLMSLQTMHDCTPLAKWEHVLQKMEKKYEDSRWV